jgi:hypothetical protein
MELVTKVLRIYMPCTYYRPGSVLLSRKLKFPSPVGTYSLERDMLSVITVRIDLSRESQYRRFPQH